MFLVKFSKSYFSGCLIALWAFCCRAESADYNFASINYLIEQEVGVIVLPKVYEKLGLEITITPLPGKRAQLEAAAGNKDGEIMRIFTYGLETPTTIRVPTPYYYLETMAFVRKDSGIKISSPEDLAHYKIAKVRGVKHTNNITRGLHNVHDFDTTKQILQLVSDGLADVALTNTLDGVATLKELEMTDVVPSENTLATLNLYHYIHEKHKGLVSKLDETIKSMQKSGELERLIKSAEVEVLAKGLYR